MCPPGTVATASTTTDERRAACLPIVTPTARGPRVDVGAWVAFAVGPDGGPGTEALCRPLAQRPAAFGATSDHDVEVSLRLGLSIPDQDMTRAQVVVTAHDAGTGAALAPAAEAVVRASVETLVDALRGLGGEASASAVQVVVRCTVRSL
jgi:hypothetical protein